MDCKKNSLYYINVLSSKDVPKIELQNSAEWCTMNQLIRWFHSKKCFDLFLVFTKTNLGFFVGKSHKQSAILAWEKEAIRISARIHFSTDNKFHWSHSDWSLQRPLGHRFEWTNSICWFVLGYLEFEMGFLLKIEPQLNLDIYGLNLYHLLLRWNFSWLKIGLIVITCLKLTKSNENHWLNWLPVEIKLTEIFKIEQIRCMN